MNDRFDDPRLLEWILNPAEQDDTTRDELARDGGASARAEELDAFLAHCRALAEEGTEVQASAGLASQVLARTTREDLSWRGDVDLIVNHLRRRIAESGWMKLAAASLLLHLLALPALAIYMLVAEPKQPEIGFIRAEDYYPEGFPEQVEDPVQDLGTDVPEGGPATDLDEAEGR